MKRGRRRLYAVTRPGGGVHKVNISPEGKITTAARVGGDGGYPGGSGPLTFDDWSDTIGYYYKNPDKAAEHLTNGVVNKLRDKLESEIKNKGNFTITYNPSDHTNADEPIVPAFVMNSKSKHVLANADDDRVVHKTVYHTGRKPSSAIMAAKKQNGSGYRVLTDSMVDVISAEDRNVLTQRVGFNQKSYHAPPIRSQVPVSLIKDLIAWNKTDGTELRSPRLVLSNVINIKQQFMIKNTAAHFPMKFTIHLVKIMNNDYAGNSLNTVLLKTFYTGTDDLNNYGDEKTGVIPKYLQHAPLQFEGSGSMQASTVLVSNKLRGLNKSSNFRSSTRILESFSKVIPPGDFWNFSHVHRCGSGIDLMSLYRSTNENSGEEPDAGFGLVSDQGNYPFHLGIIFECQGKTAEAYSIPAEGIVNSYIGSSPCSYAYEFKTSAYFAAGGIVDTNVTTPSTQVFEQDYQIQEFGTPSEVREKFFLPTELAQGTLAPTLANVGKAYVPMMTSTVSSPALFEAAQDPG